MQSMAQSRQVCASSDEIQRERSRVHQISVSHPVGVRCV